MKRLALFFICLLWLAVPVMGSDWTIFVVDTSGSMSGGRIKMAKESMIKTIDEIPNNTQVGILSFHKWEYKPSPVDKGKLVTSINGMETGGGTPLSDYMKVGADQLLLARKRGDRGGTYTLIVVTDGAENDPHKLKSYLDEIILRGIQVRAIGIDMDQDHNLAKNPEVQYTNANNPEALTKKLKEFVINAEGDASDPQATEAMFAEIEDFPGEVAYQLIQTITEQKNHPIGEPEKVENEQGQMVANEPSTVDGVVEAEGGALGVFGIIGMVFIGIIIAVMAIAFLTRR